MKKFKGMGVAMVTPFTKELKIDYKGLESLTKHLISNGTNYLVVMGTTGENPTISYNDQYSVLQHVMATNKGQLPVVYGIGGNDTKACLDRISNTNLEGIDALLSVSPYYNKPNSMGIINHFTQIADASPVPIILYNVPGRTGSMVSAKTILELAKHDNIVAVKDASGDFNHINELISKKPANFSVISGDDAFTLPMISLGMDGVISVIGNAFPKDFSKMVTYALEEKFEKARHLHYKLLPLIEAIFEDGNPGGVKHILDSMSICEKHLRPPVHAIEATVGHKIDVLLKNYNH